jgi:hypothetical protein
MKEGEGDHADIARNNTGFIRALRILDNEGGSSCKLPSTSPSPS